MNADVSGALETLQRELAELQEDQTFNAIRNFDKLFFHEEKYANLRVFTTNFVIGNTHTCKAVFKYNI